MLRAYKNILFGLIAGVVMLSSTQSAEAQLPGTYFYYHGPHTVHGIGINAQDAKDEAYLEMGYEISQIEATLPWGHFVENVIVDEEYWTTTTVYTIKFRLLIVHDDPFYEPPIGG